MRNFFVSGGLLIFLSACGSTGDVVGFGASNDFVTPQRHLDEGRFDAAISGYTTLIKSGRLSEKELEVAYINRGGAHHGKLACDEAIEDFTKAIEVNEESVEAHHNRGVCYQKLGQYDQAIEDFGRAISINPNFEQSYAKRCELYAMAWRYDDAISDCTRSSSLAPADAGRIHSLGRIYLAAGQRSAAIREYRRALEVNPGLQVARDDLLQLEGPSMATGSINETPRAGANMGPQN